MKGNGNCIEEREETDYVEDCMTTTVRSRYTRAPAKGSAF